MDLELVINLISKNCKNAACQKEIRKVTKIYFKKLVHWVPASNIPRQFYQEPNIKYSGSYNSMEPAQRDGISATEYPILHSYLNSRNNTLVLPGRVKNRMNNLIKLNKMGNYDEIDVAKGNEHFIEPSEKYATRHESIEYRGDLTGKCNVSQSSTCTENKRNKTEALWSTLNSKGNRCPPKLFDTKTETESEKANFISSLSASSAALHKRNHSFMMKNDDSGRNSYSYLRSCKKPSNQHEFNRQLKNARMYPELYPAIFTNPKTQFLSALGLVPKRICSKRILTKFDKEQRKKRLMEKRRSWFIGERKVLRDRNKLNKRSSNRLKMRNEIYGNVSKSHLSSFCLPSSRNSQRVRNDNLKKLKNNAKRPLRGNIGRPRMIKPKLIFPNMTPGTTKKDPEIIDIASSDDESPVFRNFRDANSEVTEPQIQSSSSCNQNSLSQYADLRLFGCNGENEEAMRNQMFYEQNFGYNAIFGAPNLFFGQNNAVKFPVTNNNSTFPPNDSFYMNTQTQFPMLRPFLIPAFSNSDIGVLQARNVPIITPLGPINPPNISPYFKDVQPLSKSTSSFNGQSGNSAEEQCSLASNENVVDGDKESNTNVNPVMHQASQPSKNLKLFLVNKTPKKTYLIVPPNCTYLNTAKKIIPILDRKQPIAPRIDGLKKIPIMPLNCEAKELQHRRLNNALFANVSYRGKQKESNKDIESKMARLSDWISKIKSCVTPANFHKGVEKFSQRLTNQLNVGITLVKGVRNALDEIEKNEENVQTMQNSTDCKY